MKYFLVGIFLFLTGLELQAQVDTVLIKQFSYSDYNAGIENFSGLAGPNGRLFFANSQGVLIYDGSEWELAAIANGAQAIYYLNDTVYVGGEDEIGYFVQHGNLWHYSTLNHLLKHPELLDVWQILNTKDGLYFVSYHGVFLYDGKEMLPVDVHDAYMFSTESHMISSSFNEEIKLIEKGSVVSVNSAALLNQDVAYAILPSNNATELLLFAAEEGIYTLVPEPFKLEFWDTPISHQLKEDGFYHGVEYHDSLIVCTTWEQGVIIFNKNGEIIKQIDIERGLPNQSLKELFIDENENIWITSLSGIYQMRLSLDKASADFRPTTIIKNIRNESGVVKNLEKIRDPQFIIIDYTTPGFNKEDLEYSFYLEGYDNDWSEWSKLYKKEYSNLSNGEHVFHVKARVIGSINESEEANIDFCVILPWYKLPVSYFILALAVLVGILVIIRIRNVRIRRSTLALEKIISERTSELVDEREKLKSMNSDLQIANTELDNFVYRSSHDLIAPLKSLRGLMSVTKLETKDDNLLTYFNLMENSILKLEKFISSIMDYSINSKSKQELQDVAINDLIDEIDQEIEYFDKYSSIDVIREIDAPVLNTDYKRLKIILNNLITNAIKYHNISQENPWINIKTYNDNGHYIIEIADNGLGIEPKHHGKLFEMFYRASSNSDGSGLGLYIVQDTVKKLKGEVSLVSEVNKGSTFTLKFQT